MPFIVTQDELFPTGLSDFSDFSDFSDVSPVLLKAGLRGKTSTNSSRLCF